MLALNIFEQHVQQSSKNGAMGQNFDDKNLDGLVISHGGCGVQRAGTLPSIGGVGGGVGGLIFRRGLSH